MTIASVIIHFDNGLIKLCDFFSFLANVVFLSWKIICLHIVVFNQSKLSLCHWLFKAYFCLVLYKYFTCVCHLLLLLLFHPFIFLIYFLLFLYVWVLCLPLFPCTTFMCVVLEGTRRRHHSSWDFSYRWL